MKTAITTFGQTAVAALMLLMFCTCSFAADGGKTEDAPERKGGNLAKQTQNPVADLISVPFQYNIFFETGRNESARDQV